MCGIFGFVGSPERLDAIDLSSVLSSLHHRGPDGSRLFVDAESEISCAFAHCRLAIIDLTPGGAQPMSTADGRYTLVYNGELYNYRELKQELERTGEVFASHSDTEVILRAYVVWGQRAVVRFRGIFAFAIWDAADRTLLLARDHLGVKPLYYRVDGRSLAFSSEVRTLLTTATADRRLSQEGIASYLMFGSVSEPFTIVDGVHSLSPGHIATFQNGQLRQSTYWSLPETTEQVAYDDAVAEVRHILNDAVRAQLVADVPLGIFLSGGIDSSALAAVASRVSAEAVHTFTVTFDESDYSEARYADAVARKYGTQHHEIHLSAQRALEHLEDVLAAADQPSADGINTYFVSQAVRGAGLTVALSGLGADELFGGYPHFRTFGRLRRASRAFRFTAEPLGRIDEWLGVGGASSWTRKLLALPETDGDSAAVYSVIRSMFTRRQLSFLAPKLQTYLNRGAVVENDAVNTFSRLEITGYMLNTLLRDADQMSMAHALEVRVPFLDHYLVERVLSWPASIKMSRRINKPLLVDAIGDLPTSVTHRRKMGFALPLDSWFRGPMKNWLSKTLEAPPNFLSDSAVQALWRSFLERRVPNASSRIWSLAALAAWCRSQRMTFA